MKYTVTLEIKLDLEVEAKKPSLAGDEASDLAKAAIKQAFPKAKYCSYGVKQVKEIKI